MRRDERPCSVPRCLGVATRAEDLDRQHFSLLTQDPAREATLRSLERLRLSRNALTDAGVVSLTTLPQLTHLNLYGNAAVSDASVDALAGAAALQRVDVWQTGVSDEGIARLRQRKPELDVQAASADTLAGAAPTP